MKLIDVHARLKKIAPVFRTADVMAYLDIKKEHASRLLARLEDSHHIVRIKRGVWVFPEESDPLALSEYLTAPFPCYISMQSALYFHGMISQVPAITYSVSLARTHIFKTSLGIFSIHHFSLAMSRSASLESRWQHRKRRSSIFSIWDRQSRNCFVICLNWNSRKNST